ncbi:MAG: DUF433 domain-containing protein [Thermoflexales bacterium]|nr:DUF433 domain-containing protein [Thermoflexales bacterium]
MTIVQLSTQTYALLRKRAQQANRSLDALAEQMLQRELQPSHPYVQTETSMQGSRAIIKDADTPVSVVVEYSRLGLRPEEFAEEVHPALTPAHVHDALSYYYDHQEEIDHQIAENTEESARLQLRSHMRSEQDYVKITGQQE